MGFSRQEHWSALPLPSPEDHPDPGIKPTSHVSCIGRWFFTTSATRPLTLAAAAAESRQSCLTLCDPIDGSPPGSSVPGILQARTLDCHFLVQCIKVKSESEVAQSCLTSPPHGL